ncbi:hypothetical protein A2943_00160 [Candidatus Adlerbacteria bacterium RIFCSPLOWO2_01_FULL_51_16]|uniref:Uncharacterized protein n=1 Tax=Candidatus Adlerbacteria bacterium RIFCSPLOWO2_01_FULL_51_16 TaxID=1797243 RepID=A0A1F4XF94_9BACT|nr:MAG: hypothetical protein A2943_00160 [Candidatus Adlerbacteria bacterium RIFCSPLOWO2_01_FULL_51_16]
MKVLMITGDKNFATSPRFALQRAQVETLVVVYWGRGALWPSVASGRFDVVTAQDPFWRGFIGWLIARRMGAKLNVQVHTDLSAQPFVRRVLAQIVLRRADSVRVVSERIKKQVESMSIKVPVRVLPVFVDVSRFQNIARQPHDTKTILWIGRFEPEKDPMYAIEVFEKIRETLDAKLVMLGSGSTEKKLRERAQGLPIEFPGWQDPALYLATADVVLSTSKHESYGVSIVEALAAGVPVVSPDVGIAKEAGATVKAHSEIAVGVAEILRSGARGAIQLPLLNKEAWAQNWKNTLI